MDYETRKLKTAERAAHPTKADYEALKKMNEIREGWKVENRRSNLLTAILFIIGFFLAAGIASLFRPAPTAVVSYPTEIPTGLPSVATSLRLLDTPTLRPTVTSTHTPAPTATGTVTASPTAIATATNTAVSSDTPQPSYTPLPTYTIPPTWTPPPTAVPTATPYPSPTRPVALDMVQPTAVPVNHLVNELEDTRQSLMLVGGVTSSLFLLSATVTILAFRGLRRPAPTPQVTILPETAAQPTRLILPPPTGQPMRETFTPRNPSPAAPEIRTWGETAVSNVGNVGNSVSNTPETVEEVVVPLDRAREPNEAERAYIRKLYSEGRSLRAITKDVYGVIGGRTFGYVKMAIGEGQQSNQQPQRRPIVVNSSSGRRILA